MIKLFLPFLFLLFNTLAYSQLEGVWKLAPEAGALAVGPAQGSNEWWSIGENPDEERPCLFDDYYIFHHDGSFENFQDCETWIETWQGAEAEGCGVPVAPHNGFGAAEWYVSGSGILTITGLGAYMGLPKVHNNGELTSPEDALSEIEYIITELTDTYLILDIQFAETGWWRFKFVKSWNYPDYTSFTLSDDGDITEGSEDGEVITVHLYHATFLDDLNIENWEVTGLPSGVELSGINRIDNVTAELTLAGNTLVEYDSDISVRVTIKADEFKCLYSSFYLSSRITFQALDDTPNNTVLLNKLKIYPNPAEGFISVESEEQITGIRILNVLGQDVINLNIENKEAIEIDVSHLENGLYLIEVNDQQMQPLIIK
jgi:hypothetical protein